MNKVSLNREALSFARANSTPSQLRSAAQRYQRSGLCRLNSEAPRPHPAVWAAYRHESQSVEDQKWRQLSPEETLRRMHRLEAVLFLSREPLNSRKLSQHADLLDGTEARTLIRRLNLEYDRAGRAFRVEQIAGGYQLLTRKVFSGWLRRLEHIPRETKLSGPALETLAVVAYRQPVLRADIEAIRGVSCGEILKQLMERDLVRISGRSDELGRPFLYSTSKRFLTLFGLNHLDQLPRTEIFANPSPIDETEESKDSTIQIHEIDEEQNCEEV